jgi:hypothetical protein
MFHLVKVEHQWRTGEAATAGTLIYGMYISCVNHQRNWILGLEIALFARYQEIHFGQRTRALDVSCHVTSHRVLRFECHQTLFARPHRMVVLTMRFEFRPAEIQNTKYVSNEK